MAIIDNHRRPITSLTMSAVALVALLVYEGFSGTATIPTKNDLPTVGFGSTVVDGDKVALGDTIDPIRAVIAAHSHISAEEKAFRESIPTVNLYQYEYDAYMDFIYQYGIGNWLNSSMRRYLLEGDHAKACGALLLYRYAGGYNCSTLVEGEPNKRCWGVWARQLERNKSCMGGGQ